MQKDCWICLLLCHLRVIFNYKLIYIGLPEVSCMKDVDYLKQMLSLDKKNDEDAGNHFLGLINQSKNEKFRLIDNMIHNMKHG